MQNDNQFETLSLPKVNIQGMISSYEKDIAEMERKLQEWKNSLPIWKNYLNQLIPLAFQIQEETLNSAGTLNIKWRKEIRDYLDHGNAFKLSISTQIAEKIAHRFNQESLTREFKNNVSSTLSLMHRECEVGRFQKPNTREYYYGMKKFFKKDLKTLKDEFKKEVA